MFVDEKSDDAQVLSAGINIQLESETVAKTLGNVQLAAVMGFTKIQIPKAFQVSIFIRITRHCFEYCYLQCHFGCTGFSEFEIALGANMGLCTSIGGRIKSLWFNFN